jgi:hypothetical protein
VSGIWNGLQQQRYLQDLRRDREGLLREQHLRVWERVFGRHVSGLRRGGKDLLREQHLCGRGTVLERDLSGVRCAESGVLREQHLHREQHGLFDDLLQSSRHVCGLWGSEPALLWHRAHPDLQRRSDLRDVWDLQIVRR